MKKLIIVFALLLGIKSYSQKKDSVYIVIVQFKDSASYVQFRNDLGEMKASNPYSYLYQEFIQLPAQLIKVPMDKPKNK